MEGRRADVDGGSNSTKQRQPIVQHKNRIMPQGDAARKKHHEILINQHTDKERK